MNQPTPRQHGLMPPRMVARSLNRSNSIFIESAGLTAKVQRLPMPNVCPTLMFPPTPGTIFDHDRSARAAVMRPARCRETTPKPPGGNDTISQSASPPMFAWNGLSSGPPPIAFMMMHPRRADIGSDRYGAVQRSMLQQTTSQRRPFQGQAQNKASIHPEQNAERGRGLLTMVVCL